MSGVIVYKGKYGATQQYAEWIAEKLKTPARVANDDAAKRLAGSDFVVIGTSIYIGKFQVRDWMEKHQELLKNKKIFLYLVAGTPANEKEKVQQYFNDNIPATLIKQCSLYCLPGHLIKSKLSWMDKFLLKGGSYLAEKRGEKIVTEDYDYVKPQHLAELLQEIKNFNAEVGQMPPKQPNLKPVT